MVQWQGLTFMLAKSSSLLGWILLVLGCYILLFQLLVILVQEEKTILLYKEGTSNEKPFME